MNNVYEPWVFYEDLSQEQREALDQALAGDPALAEAFARWQRVRADVRRSLEAHLPDRDLLVLYALEAKYGPERLTRSEQEALQAARSGLGRALDRHPALADVVERIGAEADDFEAAWAEHAGRPEDGRPHEPTPMPAAASDRSAVRPARSAGVRRWAGRAVAVLAVVAFALILFLVVQRDSRLVTVQTAAGEVRLIELADGSLVRLMGGSVFAYPDPERTTALNRRARLVGRAFFEITRSEQPFTLETPTALTTVLGTSFGVEADDDATEVVLATGKVALAPDAAPDRFVVLGPEEMSRVAENALPSTPVPVDLAEALKWTGLLILRTEPMEEIAALLSKRYDVPVAVAPALEDEPVSGTFEGSQPLPEILEAIAATLGADVRANPSGGYLFVPLP